MAPISLWFTETTLWHIAMPAGGSRPLHQTAPSQVSKPSA